ncbi:uncharacterized protein LOC133193486 [Saccostrea echinata]|uniref:uncharacterized protein LOC133193486 n=1 Tax=Saccostrea echinata TaxID=191078 RepID=UPI002A820C15|nr:uncharacterized protein LOC133193486 [Saccostrea echinata]
MQTADQLKFMMDTRVNQRGTSNPESSSRQKKLWIIVYFPSEDAVSHPISLQEVETLMGDTGEQAGLGEGDTCLAPYFVGDRLHTAKIIRCTGNRIQLLHEYAKFLNLRKKTDGDFLAEKEEDMMETVENEGSIWKYAKAVGGGIAVGGLTVVAAPLVLSAGGVSAVVAATVMTKAVPVLALTAAGGVAVREMVTEDQQECTKSDEKHISTSTKTTKKTQSSQSSEVKVKNHSASMLSGAGLRSAVRGVFSWFSGTSEEDDDKDSNPVNTAKDKTEDNSILIDFSDDDTKDSTAGRCTPVSSCTLGLTHDMEDNGRDWLTLENQRLWEERVCRVCKDNEVAVLFDPCGHMCACLDCSAVQRWCPMCSQFISVHHRVYRT